MRVGMNLAYLVEDSGGSGTYARELIGALLSLGEGIELTAWVGSTAPPWIHEQPWSREVRWIRLPVPGIGTPWHLAHELALIGLDASRRKVEVLHGLAYLAPVVAPGVRTITTIHDVIWIHRPEAGGRRFSIAMRTLVPPVAARASRIIAISDAARDDVATTLGIDRAKFDVAPHGVHVPAAITPDRAALSDRLGLGPEPIVLCVAAKRPHKNLEALIRALALMAQPRPQLVPPGSPNDYERSLRELAAELGVTDSVRFPGWISDAELEQLYAVARCFALPTLEEGFGMPILEAMARGVPVACSDIPVLREVAGTAAVLFDPHEPAQLAAALERLCSDDAWAEAMVAAGRARVAEFTWEASARAHLESYRRALA